MGKVKTLVDIENECIEKGLTYGQFLCEVIDKHKDKIKKLNSREAFYTKKSYEEKYSDYWTEDTIVQRFSIHNMVI